MLEGERDWCHESLSYALPPHLIEVAKRAGLRFEGLSYAALVLTRRARHAAPPETLYRIVSDRLISKGKLELYGCGERGYQRLTRLDRDRSEFEPRLRAALARGCGCAARAAGRARDEREAGLTPTGFACWVARNGGRPCYAERRGAVWALSLRFVGATSGQPLPRSMRSSRTIPLSRRCMVRYWMGVKPVQRLKAR